MNTEKIEKLKKGLTNSQISDSIKEKIREQIARLEKEDLDTSNIVVNEEEVVVIPKKEEIKEQPTTKVRNKTRTKKEVVAPVEKPLKRTVLVIAKEIREEGESWDKARERASKLINKKKDKVEENSKKELDKLLKYIASRKELDGITGKDLRRDAKRNAKQLGRRTVTDSGETSNQYGTYENKVGKTYYENRDGHGDRLSNKHKKGMPYLEEGGNINKEILDREALKYITGQEITLHHREAKNIAYQVKGKDNWFTLPIEELNEVIKNHKTSLTLFAPEKKKYEDGGYFDKIEDVKFEFNVGDKVKIPQIGNGGKTYLEDAEIVEQIPSKQNDGTYYPFYKVKCDWHTGTNSLPILYSEEELLNYKNGKFENGGDFMSGVYVDGGEIKASELNLGYQYSYDYKDDENHGSIFKEHGVFFVNGFTDGKHYKESFEKFPEAKKFYLSKKNKKLENGGDFIWGVYAEGGALYSAHTDNPIKYLELMGAKSSSDLNFSTEKNGINYYVGFRNKSGLKKAIVVAFIEDENKYMIDKEDLREMSLSANEKDVDVIELYTNYGLKLRSNEKSKIVGFDKIHKVTQFENGGDFMAGVYDGGGKIDNRHSYMMLSRLQSDADYYLGYGHRSENSLWADNVDEHIEEMKRLWNSLPEDGKPEWLSMQDILEYEKKMKSQLENGGNFMNGVYADGGTLDAPKKITEAQAKKIFEKGFVIYVKDGDGKLETNHNVSMISEKATDMNIYSGLKTSDKWSFDVLIKWIKEKVNYPIEFYTLNSPYFLYLEDGKTLEKGGDFKGGKILKQISTHKAVKEGDKIKIYERGLDIDDENFDEETKKGYPHWFKDRYLYSIPLKNKDDLFAIFENYKENNRINRAEANGEFANGGELTTGFLGKIDKVSYEGGASGFMGSLFYNKDLIRYFPSGVGNTKEDIQKTMESFLKSLEPIKVYKNSEGYLVFYKQRGVEAKKQFDNKSDANAFFEALKTLENTEIKYNYGGSVTNDRRHVNHDEDYELRYAKGTNRKGYGNVKYANGGSIDEEKIFSLDFYTKKNDRESYYDDKIVKAYSVKDVIEKAKRIAKLEEFEYVEIYHNKNFVGSISRDKGFDFVEGKGYDDYIAENETPEVFENEHGVRVQSKVAPENKSTIGDWIGKTTISREAIAYGKGGEVGDTINSNEWRVESYGKDFEKEKMVCDEYRTRKGNDSIIVEDKGIFYVLLRNSKKYPAKRVYADGGQFISSADSIKNEVKGKTQQERIDLLIDRIKEYRWSSKPITEDMWIVKTFADIYDLEPERVASLFNKHQKGSYAEGGDINDDDDMVTIIVDDYPYYLQKMGDTTHFKMSNSMDGIDKVWGSHIGEHRTENYYEDVKSWLKGGSSPDGKTYTSSNQYAKGGDIYNVKYLVPLELVPLSTQLSSFTGDSLAIGNYVDENGNDYSTAEDAIIIHKESGQKFRIPAKIYCYVDGSKLVINKANNAIVVWQTNEKVANIIDGKLDFSNKDKSLWISKPMVVNAFENKWIPSARNADDEYMKIERELNKLYSLYEDNEDNEAKQKEIDGRIKFLEDITHRLERKYESGGSLEKPYDVAYKTKKGRGMVAKRIMAKSEEEAKEKLINQMKNSDSFDKVYLAHESFEEGGDLGRIKVGQGFFQSGYGKGFDKQSSIYLINDKYYAKSKKASSVAGDGDMLAEGYVCINKEGEAFFQCWLDEHKKVSEIDKKALGGTIIGFEDPMLQGVVDVHNTGLVGETNAMSSGEMFAEGGEIPNNYEGKTAELIWNDLKQRQREHFLFDHNKAEIQSTPISIEQFAKKSYKFLPQKVKESFSKHVASGQYAKGGTIDSKRTRRTKAQIAKDNYNKEVDAYKFYVVDLENKKATSGWEHKSDAQDDLKDNHEGNKKFKVVAKSSLKTLDIPIPNEEWKYAKGGDISSEDREVYLEKIQSMDNKAQEETGVQSGGEIKSSKNLLKMYAKSLQEKLKKAGVKKASLTQSDYDYFTNDNYHLLNEFLVWNDYFIPSVTKPEQAWRLAYSKDPKKSERVSDPETITVKTKRNPTESNTKMQKATAYAKANRKEGQTWREAMKEAFSKV